MKSLIWFCMMVVLVSCSNKSGKIESELALLEGDFSELKGAKLLSDSKFFGVYDLLLSNDDLVLVYPIANPWYFSVYNLQNESFIGDFGKEGGAPNEYAGVLRTSLSHKSRTIGLFSKGMGNIYYELNLDSALANPSYEPSSIKLDYFGMNRIERDHLGRFLAISLHSDKRVIMLDTLGKETGSYFDYPFQEELADVRPELYGMIYQSKMVKSPDGKQVGVFNMDAPNWDLISLEDDEPRLINSMHLRAMKFQDQSVFEGKSKTYAVANYPTERKGFVDVAANDERIYALYSGKSIEKHGYDADTGSIVLVLNWEGEILEKLKLDFETKIIEVDQNSEFLYAIVEDEDFTSLYRYKL